MDVELNADPYPMFRRFREEAPLYFNEAHDFYAVSRYDDVNRALVDHRTFSSAKGIVLEILKSGMEIPPGIIIFEDPPIHDIHRNLLSRAFIPRKINALESEIRELTTRCLDQRVIDGNFDFVKDLGAIMPVRVVGMLFGIPEDFQQRVIEDGDRHVRTEPGKQMTDNPDGAITDGQVFSDFIDWRATHPADDLTTELSMGVRRRDGNGSTAASRRTAHVHERGGRRRCRDHHAVDRLDRKAPLGHADQRRALATDRSLVSGAIEEILRYEPPALQAARYVTRDVEFHGQRCRPAARY